MKNIFVLVNSNFNRIFSSLTFSFENLFCHFTTMPETIRIINLLLASCLLSLLKSLIYRNSIPFFLHTPIEKRMRIIVSKLTTSRKVKFDTEFLNCSKTKGPIHNGYRSQIDTNLLFERHNQPVQFTEHRDEYHRSTSYLYCL